MADEVVLKTIFQVKRGKAQAWETLNPILRIGEPGFAYDDNIFKVGDGVTPWNDLKPVNEQYFKDLIKENGDISVDNDKVKSDVKVTENGVQISFENKETGEKTELIINKDGAYYVKDGEVVSSENEILTKKDAQSAHLEVIKIYADELTNPSFSIDGVVYDNAEDAIAAAKEGDILIISGLDSSLDINKTITLDFKESQADGITVKSNGDLTIAKAAIKNDKNGEASLFNNKIMTINDGVYNRTVDKKDQGFYVAVNHGEMTINNGTFSSPGQLSSLIENGYYNYNSGNENTGYVNGVNAESPFLTIENGTFICDGSYSIKNDDKGRAEINGGNFYAEILHQGSFMTINDGYFDCPEASLFVRKLNDDINVAELVITGGTFISTVAQSNFRIEGEPYIRVTGGKFNHPVPEAYLSDGAKQNYENGFYVVKGAK